MPILRRRYDYIRTVIIICSECGENIVERSDERDVNTLAKARAYALEHEKIHLRDETK
jgi:hypothetical protein